MAGEWDSRGRDFPRTGILPELFDEERRQGKPQERPGMSRVMVGMLLFPRERIQEGWIAEGGISRGQTSSRRYLMG